MAVTSALWASGTPTVNTGGSSVQWVGAANATGVNNAVYATWAPTTLVTGWLETAGYNVQAAIGEQPLSIDSVVVTLYAHGATNRYGSKRVQLTSGGALIGSALTGTVSATAGASQTFTFSGVTWAQLATLGVRHSISKTATNASTWSVDAIRVEVNYTAPSRLRLYDATYMAQSFTATSTTTGATDGTLPGLTGSGTVDVRAQGPVAGSLSAPTGTFAGVLRVTGAAGGNLPGLTGAVAAVVRVTAVAGAALPTAAGNASAALTVGGAVGGEIGSSDDLWMPLTGGLSGGLTLTGSVVGTLPTVTGTAIGTVLPPKVLLTRATYSAVPYTASVPTGQLLGSFPALTGDVTGQVIAAGVRLYRATYPAVLYVFSSVSTYTDVYPGPPPAVVGDVGGVLPLFGGSVTVSVRDEASVTGTLPAAGGTIGATPTVPGTVAATLPMLTGLVSGQLRWTGAAAGSLPTLSGALAAVARLSGAAGGSLPYPLSGGLAGGSALTAALARSLAPFGGALAGNVIEPIAVEPWMRWTPMLTVDPPMFRTGLLVEAAPTSGLATAALAAAALTVDNPDSTGLAVDLPGTRTGLTAVALAATGLTTAALAAAGLTTEEN